MHNFHTTVSIFIAILVGYLAITLALGAKRVFFEPFTEKLDKPDEQSDPAANETTKS